MKMRLLFVHRWNCLKKGAKFTKLPFRRGRDPWIIFKHNVNNRISIFTEIFSNSFNFLYLNKWFVCSRKVLRIHLFDDDVFWHDCCIDMLWWLQICIPRNALSHRIVLSIQMWSQQAIALSEKFCSSKSFMLRENKTEKLNKTRIFTFFFGQAMK